MSAAIVAGALAAHGGTAIVRDGDTLRARLRLDDVGPLATALAGLGLELQLFTAADTRRDRGDFTLAYVFAPPYVTDPSDYVSYGYASRQIYGFAYRTLRRRMKVLGIEIPPADELMPGPIDGTTEFAAVPAAAAAEAPRDGASSNGSGDLEAAATS